MAKSSGESSSEFVSPSILEALRQELGLLEAMEPGSKPIAEVIADLLPLIKGCRARGHSWVRIAGSFQKFLPGLSVGALRKCAFELDPSLKGGVKGVDLTSASVSLIPSLEDEVAADEESDEVGGSGGDEEESDEDVEVSSSKKSKRSAASF